MATLWKRPLAFPTDNELSMAQTDELLVSVAHAEEQTVVDPMTMSSTDRRRRVWALYFIGFMVIATST